MPESGASTISVEARWFKISVFAGSAVAAGVTFANIIYYSKLRKDDKMTAIKMSTATTMMWVNIILFVVSLLLLLWSVWALLFSKSKRESQTAAVSGYAKKFLTSEEAAIGPSQSAQPPVVTTVTQTSTPVPQVVSKSTP